MTSVKKDEAKKILTDLFAAFVEISRRTAKEARLSFKGFGYLHLFKNRELAFKSKEAGLAVSDLKQLDDIFRARNQEREDLSFIDSASAVLSRGGGHNFHVKSSAIKKLSTVTPPSNLSVASSIVCPEKRRHTAYDSASVARTHESIDKVWNRYK